MTIGRDAGPNGNDFNEIKKRINVSSVRYSRSGQAIVTMELWEALEAAKLQNIVFCTYFYVTNKTFSLSCLRRLHELSLPDCVAVSNSSLGRFQPSPSFKEAAALVRWYENGSPSAMDPLAVIGEVRTQVNSIKNRIANYCSGPSTFTTLRRNVDFLDKHVSEMEALFHPVPLLYRVGFPSSSATHWPKFATFLRMPMRAWTSPCRRCSRNAVAVQLAG